MMWLSDIARRREFGDLKNLQKSSNTHGSYAGKYISAFFFPFAAFPAEFMLYFIYTWLKWWLKITVLLKVPRINKIPWLLVLFFLLKNKNRQLIGNIHTCFLCNLGIDSVSILNIDKN